MVSLARLLHGPARHRRGSAPTTTFSITPFFSAIRAKRLKISEIKLRAPSDFVVEADVWKRSQPFEVAWAGYWKAVQECKRRHTGARRAHTVCLEDRLLGCCGAFFDVAASNL